MFCDAVVVPIKLPYIHIYTYSLFPIQRRHLAADLEIRREMHRLHHCDERLQFVVLHDVGGLPMERFQDALALVDGHVAKHFSSSVVVNERRVGRAEF